MEMALTGDRISAQQALEWGLVNRVVADEELERCEKTSAKSVSALSPQKL
jgi:enoyl-CoA hydratase/carnithine racemase